MTPQVATGSSSVELWDRVARLYDLQRWLERPALRVAIALADPRSDDFVLDVGTGTGALLRELAASGARPKKVVGVDASRRMLERARSAALPGEWRLEQADARKLPFGDESFSLVFAAYLLNVLSDEDGSAVLREVHRVLVPDGRLVVVSPVASSSRFAPPYRWLAELLPQLLPWFCAGIRLLDPEPLIRASGLQPEQRRYVSRGYPSVCLLAVRNAATVPDTPGVRTERLASPNTRSESHPPFQESQDYSWRLVDGRPDSSSRERWSHSSAAPPRP